MRNQIKARILWTVLFSAIVLISLIATPVQSGEYVIGPEDVLNVSFWQDTKKNDQVKVDQDGMISLDIAGKIKAAGLTPSELQDEIVRRIRPFDKKISQAIVRVFQYNYNSVFVIGQIKKGGKLSFERIPDLWTLINEAGGTTQFSDLTRVTIVRGGDQSGKVEVVNVQKAISEGKLGSLPKIRRLDTIEIPSAPGAVTSGDLAQSADQKNLVYIIGAVNTPGPIRFEENMDVMEALALAKGPTADADLKHARLILKDGAFAQTIELNLKEYSKTGYPRRYILKREDMFILPRKKGGLFGLSTASVAAALGVVTSALLIMDRLDRNNNPNVNINAR